MASKTEVFEGRLLLGVCGSIAAYKSPDLLRKIQKQGFQVKTLLTASAQNFVAPKVLESFVGERLLSPDIFSDDHLGTDHIEWARWSDQVLVYGATANFIAKLANGFADDFLSLQLSALDPSVPVFIVPAMNTQMWENPAVMANVEKLKARSFQFIGPVEGRLACGEFGVGHVASDQEIIDQLFLKKTAHKKGLEIKENYWTHKKVLISAGPMKTSLDSVRFLQNSSSGKMGLAMARAAKRYGAKVSVLLGPVSSSIKKEFSEFHCIDYESPEDYHQSLNKMFPWSDVFFSAAAVLDFQFMKGHQKIARESLKSELNVSIKSVDDYVKKVSKIKSEKQMVVAFSLEQGEPELCLQRARKKLKQKGADYALVNRCSEDEVTGPNADTNEMWLLSSSNHESSAHFEAKHKNELALEIFEHFSKLKKKSTDVFTDSLERDFISP